jgi:hypothetical protein
MFQRAPSSACVSASMALTSRRVERRDRRVDFCAAQNRLTASPAAAQRLFLFIDL